MMIETFPEAGKNERSKMDLMHFFLSLSQKIGFSSLSLAKHAPAAEACCLGNGKINCRSSSFSVSNKLSSSPFLFPQGQKEGPF